MPKTMKVLPMHVEAGYSHQHGYQGVEAPNQTFKPGNLISLDANGKYAATPAGAPAAAAKNRIALAPGQNLAAPTRKAEFAHPHECGWIEATLGGAAATAANIKVGTECGYDIDPTTGQGFVNLADNANKVFRIESAPVTGDIGDTNIRAHVSILATAR